jgi:hypothetical protein
VECERPDAATCRGAQAALTSFDIAASRTTLRSSEAAETLRLVVGPWPLLREDQALAPIESGPQVSGVFAEPRGDGRTIALLDERGRVARTLGPGGGLVAATALGDELPVWAVTGTDEAGVAAAVRALRQDALRDRFAVAVDGDEVIPLPVPQGSR